VLPGLKQNFILILCDSRCRFQSSAVISRDEKSAIKRGKIAMLRVHVSVETYEVLPFSAAVFL